MGKTTILYSIHLSLPIFSWFLEQTLYWRYICIIVYLISVNRSKIWAKVDDYLSQDHRWLYQTLKVTVWLNPNRTSMKLPVIYEIIVFSLTFSCTFFNFGLKLPYLNCHIDYSWFLVCDYDYFTRKM